MSDSNLYRYIYKKEFAASIIYFGIAARFYFEQFYYFDFLNVLLYADPSDQNACSVNDMNLRKQIKLKLLKYWKYIYISIAS